MSVGLVKGEAGILLEKHLGELGLKFWKEYRFSQTRKWRFDYLIQEHGTIGAMSAIEIEGGAWKQGRHNRAQGFMGDMEKYREAAALGYKVYRFTPEEVLKGVALKFLAKHCT